MPVGGRAADSLCYARRRARPDCRHARARSRRALGFLERGGSHARARFQRWRELSPAERDKLRERWQKFRDLTPEQQEALREAYRHYLSLPPAQRDATSKRWEQMSPEEQRRAISRRQGSKPGTYDKWPCPPC